MMWEMPSVGRGHLGKLPFSAQGTLRLEVVLTRQKGEQERHVGK